MLGAFGNVATCGSDLVHRHSCTTRTVGGARGKANLTHLGTSSDGVAESGHAHYSGSGGTDIATTAPRRNYTYNDTPKYSANAYQRSYTNGAREALGRPLGAMKLANGVALVEVLDLILPEAAALIRKHDKPGVGDPTREAKLRRVD